MAATKRTVSFDPEVWAELEQLAAAERIGVSTVVNRTLRHQLRIQRGLTAVAQWEADNGAFTDQELAKADQVLHEAGIGVTGRRSAFGAQ